jgi:RNA polymerase sigma-70 factor (ECF subfamily)
VIGWLLNIARSRAIDRLRSATSRRRMESRVEAEPAPAAVLPDDEAERRRLGQRVRDALVALGPPHSEVLELAYFGGLSQTEIAARLSAPLGTVKSWTRQALLRLKDRFPGEARS